MTRSLQPAWFLIVVSMGWACLLTPVLSAQPAEHVTLTGTVVDEETEAPLVGVHVFIATSMIGTTTDREGAFRLEKVPLGAHRLVLSTAPAPTRALRPTTFPPSRLRPPPASRVSLSNQPILSRQGLHKENTSSTSTTTSK